MLGRDVKWRLILLPVRWPFSLRRKARCQATSSASRFLRSTAREWPLAASEAPQRCVSAENPRVGGPRTILRQCVWMSSRPQRSLQRQLRVAAAHGLKPLCYEVAAREVRGEPCRDRS